MKNSGRSDCTYCKYRVLECIRRIMAVWLLSSSKFSYSPLMYNNDNRRSFEAELWAPRISSTLDFATRRVGSRHKTADKLGDAWKRTTAALDEFTLSHVTTSLPPNIHDPDLVREHPHCPLTHPLLHNRKHHRINQIETPEWRCPPQNQNVP